MSAQSERCTILEFNAIATPALGRESSPASSSRLEADVSVGFLLILTIIVSMFFDGGMFGKEKRIMTQSHYPGTFIFPTHFLRQHYLLQVNGYNLSRNLSLSDFGWAPPSIHRAKLRNIQDLSK